MGALAKVQHEDQGPHFPELRFRHPPISSPHRPSWRRTAEVSISNHCAATTPSVATTAITATHPSPRTNLRVRLRQGDPYRSLRSFPQSTRLARSSWSFWKRIRACSALVFLRRKAYPQPVRWTSMMRDTPGDQPLPQDGSFPQWSEGRARASAATRPPPTAPRPEPRHRRIARTTSLPCRPPPHAAGSRGRDRTPEWETESRLDLR